MRLTWMYFKMGIKKALQYPVNFMFFVVSIAPIHLIQIVFSWFIAKRFDGLDSWDGWNLIFLYSILLVSYGIAQVFARRFRYLEEEIISGKLDTYFIKPIPILYGLMFQNLHITEMFSQLFPPIIILIVSCFYNSIRWSLIKVLILLGAIIGGAFIQMAMFLLIGSVAFWTTRSNSLEHIFFAFKDFLNYPLHVYGQKVLAFLTYVFPLAFVNYYPALYILGKAGSGSILCFMTVPVAMILSGIAFMVWRVAVKHYNSTGS